HAITRLPIQPDFVGGPGSISNGGGDGCASSGFRIMSPNGRSHTRRVSNRPVPAWARHHLTKNRLRSLVPFLRSGGEVVRGLGCKATGVQRGAEFGVRATGSEQALVHHWHSS